MILSYIIFLSTLEAIGSKEIDLTKAFNSFPHILLLKNYLHFLCLPVLYPDFKTISLIELNKFKLKAVFFLNLKFYLVILREPF